MGERYLSILSNGDDGIPNVSLHVEHVEGGLRLEVGSQRLLDAVMRDGDYITMDPPVIVTPDAPRAFGPLSVELHREEVPIASVTRWDLRLVVRVDPAPDGDETGGLLLQNTLTGVACADPTVAVRQLEPRLLLVERECRVDDETDSDLSVGAWLCDVERGRCD